MLYYICNMNLETLQQCNVCLLQTTNGKQQWKQSYICFNTHSILRRRLLHDLTLVHMFRVASPSMTSPKYSLLWCQDVTLRRLLNDCHSSERSTRSEVMSTSFRVMWSDSRLMDMSSQPIPLFLWGSCQKWLQTHIFLNRFNCATPQHIRVIRKWLAFSTVRHSRRTHCGW